MQYRVHLPNNRIRFDDLSEALELAKKASFASMFDIYIDIYFNNQPTGEWLIVSKLGSEVRSN